MVPVFYQQEFNEGLSFELGWLEAEGRVAHEMVLASNLVKDSGAPRCRLELEGLG